MHKNYYYFGALAALLISTAALAQADFQLVEPQRVIQGLKKSLALLQQKTRLPVIFPEKIPFLPQHPRYYIYTEMRPNTQNYVINIDTTPDCHGAHYCNMGRLIASRGDNPQIYYSTDNQVLTSMVQLANGKTGYFTPAHTMADYWPAQLEWREKRVLYRLSWNLGANMPGKAILVAMANSIKG